LARERRPFELLSNPVPDFRLTTKNTSLIVMDLQHFTSRLGMLADIARDKGVATEFAEYFELLDEALPQVRLLIDAFRRKRMPVIHTRYRPASVDGQDLSAQMNARGYIFGACSEEAEFLPEVLPAAGEIIIDKTCDNPFNCSGIDSMLKQMKVRYLVVCGVRCPGPIELFSLDAADRGYGVIVVSDAVAGCARGAAKRLSGGLVRVRSTDAVINIIESIRE